MPTWKQVAREWGWAILVAIPIAAGVYVFTKPEAKPVAVHAKPAKTR